MESWLVPLRDSNVVQFQQYLSTAKVSYHTVIGYSATTIFGRVTEACNNEKRIKKTETAKQSRLFQDLRPYVFIGLLLCKLCVKGYDFWKSYLRMVVFPSFAMFSLNFVFERSSKLYLLWSKIIASLLI